MAKGIKTGGREVGTPNKITKDIREALKSVLEDEVNQLPELLTKLEPLDRLEVLAKLLQYAIPRVKETNEPQEAKDFTKTISIKYEAVCSSCGNAEINEE